MTSLRDIITKRNFDIFGTEIEICYIKSKPQVADISAEI